MVPYRCGMNGVVIRVTTIKNEVYETGAPWPVPAAVAANRQAALDGLYKLQQLRATPGAIPDDFYERVREGLLELAREPERIRCTVGLMLAQYDADGDISSIKVWGVAGEGSALLANPEQRAAPYEELDIGDTDRVLYMNAEDVLELDRKRALSEFQEAVTEEVAEMTKDAPPSSDPKPTNGASVASS